MDRKRVILGIAVLMLVLISVGLIGAKEAKDNGKVDVKVLDKINEEGKARVIVVLKDSGKKSRNNMIRENSIEGIGEEKVGHKFNTINAFSASLSIMDLDKLASDANVEKIYYDRPLSIDLQDSVPIINGTNTWKLQDSGINLTGKGQTICIIDTGIDYTHPDLGNCTPTKLTLNGAVENLTTPVESTHNYANDFYYTWNITMRGYSQIAVHFVNISTESYYDYVEIVDSNNKIVAIYSGSKQDIWSPTVSGDTIYVRLKTDESIVDYGFYIDQVINGTTNTTYDWSNCSKIIGGWDIRNSDPDPKDDQGHGTHVAGIVAANGVAKGVAPEAKIIAIKALSSGAGTGTTSDVVAGIEWCTNRSSEFNISVISMSLGGGNSSAYCDENDTLSSTAINNAVSKNIAVVVASANNGWTDKIAYPACIQNAIPVGATNKTDAIASYSNRNWMVQLFAPGSSINSTCNGGGYCLDSGTSMATPHVAGAFAIINQFLRLQGTTKTPQEIESAFNATGKTIPDSGSGLNFSRINVRDAIITLDIQAPNVSLVSPADSLINNSAGGLNLTFRCNAIDLSLKNVTFYLWNATDVYNISMTGISGANATAEFNLTGLAEGEYNWNCLFYDLNGNSAFAAANYSIKYDLTAPKITINSPQNNSWYKQGIFNISINENGNCYYHLSDSSANISMNSTDNRSFYATNLTLTTVTYNITYQCGDNAGNLNISEGIYFNIDRDAPNITLLGPAEGYSATGTTTVSFQYNASDNLNLTNCSLVLNGLITDYNSSAINNTNTISRTLSAGSYNWNINCTDQVGNIGNSSIRSLTINSPPDGGEGGGGGGGGGAANYNYIANESQLSDGYAKALGKGDKITFKIKEVAHTLALNQLGANYANITINSAPINLLLMAGQEIKINLTSGKFYDLLVKLEGIIGAKANITIKTINEQIERKIEANKNTTNAQLETPSKEISEPDNRFNADISKDISNEKENISAWRNWMDWAICVLVLAVILAFVIYLIVRAKPDRDTRIYHQLK